MILLLGIFIAYTMQGIVSAILGSIVLQTLFLPMYVRLTEKNRINKSFSAIIIIVMSFLIIVLPFASLFYMLYTKIIFFKEHPSDFTNIVRSIDSFFEKNFQQKNIIEGSLNKMSAFAMGVFSSFMDTLLSTLLIVGIMYFILYYMLVKREAFERILIKYLPFREKNLRHFATELKNVTYSNVVGQGIISLAQGVLLSLGFVIFGFPDPVFWGIVCFFLSFLPVIGSPVVFIPASIFAFTAGDTFGGVGILLWGAILVMNIDNVLRLIINKKMGNIHPLITIVGVVIGIPVFGILGLVYGPMILALFVLLVKVYEEGFSTETFNEKENIVQIDKIHPVEEQ